MNHELSLHNSGLILPIFSRDHCKTPLWQLKQKFEMHSSIAIERGSKPFLGVEIRYQPALIKFLSQCHSYKPISYIDLFKESQTNSTLFSSAVRLSKEQTLLQLDSYSIFMVGSYWNTSLSSANSLTVLATIACTRSLICWTWVSLVKLEGFFGRGSCSIDWWLLLRINRL